MQLASQGTRAAARNAANIISRNTGRSFHSARPVPTNGAVQKLFSQSRLIFSRFFAHLTAPGLGSVPIARSISNAAPGRFATIVRTKLATPLQPRFFPRSPSAPQPCSVTNIGLGSARKFSTGRSVFQNIVENAPIAGRAFYEADWEIHGFKHKEAMKKALKENKAAPSGKQTMKAKSSNKIVLQPMAEETSSTESELERYFRLSAVPQVSTQLLVPLAPTPTSRVPLSVDPGEHQSFLPLPELAHIHNSHQMHSLRVHSLFARLDASNVWDRGVICSAYAHSSNAQGECTILKVEFVGWTKDQVRSVIGESGSGWCVLEETSTIAEPDSDTMSDTSSGDSSETRFIPDAAVTDSFVLPTLDFSSTFISNSSSSSPPSEPDMFSDTCSDTWSDTFSDTGSGDGWMTLSSDFVRRSTVESRATLF
ncbi:hypothetical protein C8J56DRAFT_978489 [Mycena floridula]|nr:hypothetical protein C8J56DRAFT_978489 [Mycena floridula]